MMHRLKNDEYLQMENGKWKMENAPYLAQRTQRAQRQAVDCNAPMNAHHCELPTFVYRSSLLRLPNSLAHTSMPTILPASLHTSYFLLHTSFVFVDKIIGILM
jgi:hypothetical protein